jgi:hypothetical protein
MDTAPESPGPPAGQEPDENGALERAFLSVAMFAIVVGTLAGGGFEVGVGRDLGALLPAPVGPFLGGPAGVFVGWFVGAAAGGFGAAILVGLASPAKHAWLGTLAVMYVSHQAWWVFAPIWSLSLAGAACLVFALRSVHRLALLAAIVLLPVGLCSRRTRVR